jgi:hypothetical protein
MPYSTYIEQHLMGTGSMLGNAEIVLPRDDILLDQQIDVVILYFGLYVFCLFETGAPDFAQVNTSRAAPLQNFSWRVSCDSSLYEILEYDYHFQLDVITAISITFFA